VADVDDRGENRGQLLLIAAIGLAILLVLLALALNTAVFGGVHVAATDDGLQEERGAIQYQDGVSRGVEGLLPVVSNDTADYAQLEDDLEDELRGEVATWSEVADREYARDGVATSASVTGVEYGTYIVHNDTSRTFTNASGNTTWTVVEDAPAVRGFEMNVSNDTLVKTDDCAANDACFNVSVNDGAWLVTVYKKSSGNQDIVIDVVASNGATCQTNDSYVVIDFTDGTFDATGCENDGFATFVEDADGPYTVTYTNANNANGTYELIVDKTADDSDFYEPDTGKSPRRAPSVVGANVAVAYQSTHLTYRDEIRVTPGGPDG
jgi:hypothetical protein